MSDSSAADLTLTFATRAYKRVDQFPVLLTMIAINEKEAEPMVDGLARRNWVVGAETLHGIWLRVYINYLVWGPDAPPGDTGWLPTSVTNRVNLPLPLCTPPHLAAVLM